ncbi:MAG: RidA family protein [Nitrospirae bacterium]|nr:MAG: RidA family protein [Nitrospirota bacterium]
MASFVEDRLRELGLALPPPPAPVATYIPASRAGNLLFVSGVIPVRQGQPLFRGKLGQDLTVEQGYEAARIALLNALAIIKEELGSLNSVRQIVRMTGYVASHTGFHDQPAVINGASDLLVAVFGVSGRHARLAIGVAELPLAVPIELELIVQIEENLHG